MVAAVIGTSFVEGYDRERQILLAGILCGICVGVRVGVNISFGHTIT
jgi:hypothetical protein